MSSKAKKIPLYEIEVLTTDDNGATYKTGFALTVVEPDLHQEPIGYITVYEEEDGE